MYLKATWAHYLTDLFLEQDGLVGRFFAFDFPFVHQLLDVGLLFAQNVLKW
jgi:hypothetical protein